jgi:tetrahydromethanopterin S-methyltransferase subunit G
VGLSEQEQKLLDELERGLYASDSGLAQKLGKPGARSPQRIIAGAALVIIGLSLLVVAVILQVALFGVGAFLAMLTGLVLATSSNSQNPENLGKSRPSAKKPNGPAASGKTFFEDRWDKRQK